MHGKVPTLQEVILELTPQTEIDLQCNEQLDSSEDEDEDEVDHLQERPQQARQAKQHTCYLIHVPCCQCKFVVQLDIQSTKEDLRVVQQLLMGALTVTCPLCASSN
uniref:Protein E7 n=1 Tax=Human papillomavirus 56 TaxID=10596 RepID=A9XCQ5_HPV56|nr:putative transforming protein E7 [human papillomavirus 56]ABO76811.1 putative transforming protein E7 [human papillomavirus 56]ALT54859.1 E7 [human papillomavirus 56]ALT54866.1 E7 [human papillomavirus 56]ALT54873.1 E7 [human papillomavirus 56]